MSVSTPYRVYTIKTRMEVLMAAVNAYSLAAPAPGLV
jgi:hypothetical protein